MSKVMFCLCMAEAIHELKFWPDNYKFRGSRNFSSSITHQNMTIIFWQQNYFYHWLRYNKLQGGLLEMGLKYCISKVSWEQVLVGTLISLKIGRLLGRAALVLSWAEFWQFLIVVCYHRIACLKASQIFGTNQCKQTALQLQNYRNSS